jgi:hypothetical protein
MNRIRLFMISQSLCAALSMQAQQLTMTGILLDEKGKGLEYATLALLNPADSTLAYFALSGAAGHFEIRNAKPGNYLFQAALLGYQTLFKNVSLPENKELGAVIIKASAMTLSAVQIDADRIPIRLKKDTLEYDAAAFKTKPDAVAEDLLKKMPGIEVDKAGNIKAQGEDVKHVLVDGKEFFGDDPKIATRNLPADAIKKVQVLDKKSEESSFSGIKDGAHDKTINLVLKDDKKNAWFGDAMVGIGTDSHYQTSEKLYRFSATTQFAALGMLNNINQFGFTFQDYLNFNGGMRNLLAGNGSSQVQIGDHSSFPINFGQPEIGLINSGACGLNYTYEKRKGNRFNISYLGDGIDKSLSQYTFSQNFAAGTAFIKNDTLSQKTQGRAHRLNFDIRLKPDTLQSVTVNGGLELNSNKMSGTLNSYSMADHLLINTLASQTNDRSNEGKAHMNATYLRRLEGNWKLLKASADISGSQTLSSTSWNNLTAFLQPGSLINDNQFQHSNAAIYNYAVGISFTRALPAAFYIEPQIKAGTIQESYSRKQGYLPGESNLIDSLSPLFTRSYYWIRPALTFKRNTEKARFNFTPRMELGTTSNSIAGGDKVGKEFFYFTPVLSFENDYRSGCRYGLFYESFVNTASAQQLLPVINNINPLQLFVGNNKLSPEYVQSMRASWLLFDQFSFTSFFAELNGDYTRNNISWSRTIDPQNLSQRFSLYNAPEAYRLVGSFEYSRPVPGLSMKLRLNLRESWSRGLSLINSEQNITSNQGHEFTLSLENRKKQKWDLSAGAGVQLSEARYSVMSSLNNSYSNYSIFADVRYLPNERWYISTSADITQYNAGSFDKSLSVPVLKLGITRYMLKNKQGVLSLEVFDLLNRNTGVQRISELNYLQQQQSNIIGRYVMISFKYRLNKFNSKEGEMNVEINGKKS